MQNQSTMTAPITPTDIAIAKRIQSIDPSDCQLYSEDGFWVVDLNVVRRQLERWRKELPLIRPFYAVKCNPTPRLLAFLAQSSYNLGFDCATHAEISQILNLGVPPENIIYANPCKAPSHLRYAAAASVRTMTFDNSTELYKIRQCAPDARCVIRIKLTPGAASHTDGDIETPMYDLSLKYGVTFEGARDSLLLARRLGLSVVGIAFHVGSGQADVRAYARYIVEARKVWRLAAETGHVFSLLDIGGGFMDERFEEAAGVIREVLEREFGDMMRDGNVQIIAEPGRYICAPGFTLATNVIAVRAEDEDSGGVSGKRAVYLADGMYSNINAAMWPGELTFPTVVRGRRMRAMDEAEVAPVSPVSNDSGVEFDESEGSNAGDGEVGMRMEGALQEYTVWGPTCDSSDVILKSAWLPRGIEVGDWFVFKGLGAYSVCMRNPFNGFSTEHEFYYIDE
ncbi:hypothetical protein TWF696_004972 [Orbilia brochopaga]|uniref:Orn/DAP/Arg decarboxylase 2 N-terminal domain-containing protein n=1 Tax=Orbilia brochopaga TaxID=3140254 RepID=A0AAV9V236_9PEZI